MLVGIRSQLSHTLASCTEKRCSNGKQYSIDYEHCGRANLARKIPAD